MVGRYPEIEPYDHGMLDVGAETSFTGRSEAIPTANPAVVLHGGQGSGCTMGVRRYFDPSAYRIVLFDQRGCGRSTPHASDPDTDLRPGIRHGRIVLLPRRDPRLPARRGRPGPHS